MAGRVMALAGLALVLTAIAGPAAAQAEELFWWEDDNGVELFLEKPKAAGPSVEFTFTVPAAGIEIGPCASGPKTKWAGFLFNTPERGEGEFFAGGFEGQCFSNIIGCSFEVTPEFEWFFQLEDVGGLPFVYFPEVALEFNPSPLCPMSEFSVAGEMAGAHQNGESRTTFEEAEGLLINGFLPVEVDGEIIFGTNMLATP